MSEWISVVDRLPDEGALVLVVVHTPDAPAKYAQWREPRVDCAKYQKGSWSDRNNGYWNPKYLTHWMPLPEPPAKPSERKR